MPANPMLQRIVAARLYSSAYRSPKRATSSTNIFTYKKLIIMTITDFQVLGKKIIVGILIFLIPLIIIAGGLWFTNQLFKPANASQTHQNAH